MPHYESVVEANKRAQEALYPKSDPINSPDHYTSGGIETIDFITAKGLCYELGNVVKYVSRAQFKGNYIEDLEKARWYLNHRLQTLKDEKDKQDAV